MKKLNLKPIAPFIPYFAVGAGMYLIHNAWAAILSYNIAMLLVLIFNPPRFKINCRDWKLWSLTSVIYLSCGLVLYWLLPLITSADKFVSVLNSYGLRKETWLGFVIYFSLVHSIIEELFWRGYLRDDSIGVKPNDILFAGYHGLVVVNFVGIPWALLVVLATIFAGWLWRHMRRGTESLSLPVLTHIFADFSMVMGIGYFVGWR